MSKIFEIKARKPNLVSEEAARRLEAAIEAKGEGVAGQASAAVALQAREPTSSNDASIEPSLPPASIQSKPIELPSIDANRIGLELVKQEPAEVTSPEPEAPAAAAPRNTVSSRARGTTKSQARELPTTGIGTLHNPRVRKTDGVKTRSTTVHLPIQLAQKLAVHCAMTGRKQSEVIAEAMEALLN